MLHPGIDNSANHPAIVPGPSANTVAVMAAEAAKTGHLAVSEDECRDVIWSMTDGMLWHTLVNERGWSNSRFADWLGRMWVGMLVRM